MGVGVALPERVALTVPGVFELDAGSSVPPGPSGVPGVVGSSGSSGSSGMSQFSLYKHTQTLEKH